MKHTNLYIAQAGLIAALYFALTLISSALGLAYGPLQFRLSEVLCILPVFTPAAIPGLAIGCVLANLSSPYGVIDIVVGLVATTGAAIVTRALRGVRIKGLPVASALPPVIFNAFGVALTITATGSIHEAAGAVFFTNAAWVALGEFVCAVILGLGFYKVLDKRSLKKYIEL